MSMLRRAQVLGWLAGLFLVVSSGLRADAESEAEALLARVQANYTDMPALEAVAIVRELRLAPAGGGAAPRALSTVYQRVVITKGAPDNWRIISQRERELNGNPAPERTIGFGKVGSGDGEVMVLDLATQKPARAPLPAALFRQEVVERLGLFARQNLIFTALFVKNAEGASEFPLGLEKARVEGSETLPTGRLVRISAMRSPARGRIILWVDEATGTITRTIEGAGLTAPAGAPRELRETLYRYDFSRGRHVVHFDLDDGWNEAQPGIASTARFVDVPELLVAAGAPAGEADNEPGFGPSRRSTPGGLASGSSTNRASSLPEQDVSGHMESIVMIEGEDGVGTGFVTRLRGIDFVVTNLHVIGGNDRIRVTTVRGVEIPVAGMFGAAGRDIAILRIQGENTVPPLAVAEDPLKSVKLDDQVTVVGNRRGGGVATRVSGLVRGIGPNRVEVDAPFEPGNSGSPIIHAGSGEVIGVASFSQTRELDELDAASQGGRPTQGSTRKTEQRWFGFRMDGVEKWEAIDLARWRQQAQRISVFEADSEAIYYAMHGRFKEASTNPRVRPLIDRFIERYERVGGSQIAGSQEVMEFFHGLRALAATGVRELTTGDYYDFFRTSEYWESSIPQQLRARADLTKRLERASENSALFLSRVRR